jgi:predicted DNA-binding transcriptional regulator AlpA
MTKLLRFSDLKERRIAENWTRVRRLQEEHNFPRGFLLSPQTRVWDEAEVEEWLDGRRAASASTGCEM